ncbi:hypothetical protein A2572_02495 [Candidatus Collierbacteria bacterium RIFOXYD1_FULL_40_9]|uniref:Uncharacterized protein n=1 Tax=Candidatus Collierbacteria bacterium RIFOXYD1_FULL_40_9 TaxID=1817731 RepID=A0A1F5FP98_9BACT|nr:MAG: hypothetical protein A2572_02495 [Candidatus Collierbacteria bacterium RIFOXYD1_FULL_40_9]
MNIEPKIGIQMTDRKDYLLVAMLVDRSDFLKDIQEIRGQLGVVPPYIPPKYGIKHLDETAKHYLIGNLRIIDIWNDIKVYSELIGKYPVSIDKTLTSGFVFAESLLKKYGKSPTFLPVILAAILVGSISEYDFLSTQFVELDTKQIREMCDDPLYENRKFTAIMINPETTKAKVIQVYDFISKYYFKNPSKKVDPNDGLLSVYEDVPRMTSLDTISNIERDRKWYWMNEAGVSLQKIADLEEFTSRECVKEAVKQYRTKLSGVV